MIKCTKERCGVTVTFLLFCSVADPESGAFLTPGFGIGKKSRSGSGIRIRNKHPRSYFRELRNYFRVKILEFFDAVPFPGSGIFLTLDQGYFCPPDPQHCFSVITVSTVILPRYVSVGFCICTIFVPPVFSFVVTGTRLCCCREMFGKKRKRLSASLPMCAPQFLKNLRL